MRLDRGIASALLLVAASGVAVALPPSLEATLASQPRERATLEAREAALRAMTPEALAAFRARVAAWDALPETDRRARREAFDAWRALPEHERAQLRVAATRAAALAPEERAALRERFDAQDAGLRRGWLLGPTVGTDWLRLHALFAQVPVADREALLALLHGLAPGERADLVVLAQRTPPADREALRRALLSTSAGQRGAWLRARVER